MHIEKAVIAHIVVVLPDGYYAHYPENATLKLIRQEQPTAVCAYREWFDPSVQHFVKGRTVGLNNQ